MNFTIESELEDDGRWLKCLSVLAYGATREEAMSRAPVLAPRVIAERLEHGEATPQSIHSPIPARASGRRRRSAKFLPTS